MSVILFLDSSLTDTFSYLPPVVEGEEIKYDKRGRPLQGDPVLLQGRKAVKKKFNETTGKYYNEVTYLTLQPLSIGGYIEGIKIVALTISRDLEGNFSHCKVVIDNGADNSK